MSPSPISTVRAVAWGHAPRVLQARGWVLCGLTLAPVLACLLGELLGRGGDSRLALALFHNVLVSFILPIMVLVAAPAGIREDLEQRTLPLVLARPAVVWALPLAKGLVWFLWGSLWLAASGLGLMLLGTDPATAALQAAALVLAYWAETAFMSLLVMVFKRGLLWGALVLLGWENALPVLPATLQRFTFLHHLQSLSGSRGGLVAFLELLAQPQVASPPAVSALVLALAGLGFWALCGWKLQVTPVGLAGREAEG